MTAPDISPLGSIDQLINYDQSMERRSRQAPNLAKTIEPTEAVSNLSNGLVNGCMEWISQILPAASHICSPSHTTAPQMQSMLPEIDPLLDGSRRALAHTQPIDWSLI